LDMKGRSKTNVEDAETLEERIYELDNKIEEYCNGIIEQFEKVAPKEDLITLRVIFL
jgi:phosphate uptake regulator